MRTIPVRHVLLFLALFLITACSPSGPLFQLEPLQAEERHGLLYIFRPDKFELGLIELNLEISGIHVATLNNNGYTVLRVQPGEWTLRVMKSEWIEITPSLHSFLIEKGNILFVRVEPSFTSLNPPKVPVRVEFEDIDEEDAFPKISNNRFQIPIQTPFP